MSKISKVLGGLAAAALLGCVVFPVQAAGAETGAQKDAGKAPIVIQAEELYFSDSTGNLFAKGNVVIEQNKARLMGDLVRGNAKQNEVWIDDQATFIEGAVNLTGSGVHYNYKDGTGSMLQGKGMVGSERVSGNDVRLLPDEYIIHDGTMTRCPARVPDYRVTATKVEIWPGDKLIAYNAKFWIKNTVLFAMPKYQKSLRKGDSQTSEFPKLGYSTKDGVSVKQHLEVPVGGNVAVFGDLAYYGKRGYRPSYGLIDRERAYSLSVVQGHFRDGDAHWIKKEPEIKLDFYSHRLGALPVSYNFYALYGKWVEDNRTSWHQDYNIYFSGDPIKLGDATFLSLGTGFQHVRESYDGSVRNTIKYDAAISRTWSPRLATWVAYHYTQNNNTLFDYGSSDLSRQLDVGFNVKIDRLNSMGFAQTYDLTNSRVYDQDVTWYRNLHCWETAVTYRIKRKEFIWDISTVRF